MRARQAVVSRLSCGWRRKSGSHAHPEAHTFGRPDHYNTPWHTDKPVEPRGPRVNFKSIHADGIDTPAREPDRTRKEWVVIYRA